MKRRNRKELQTERIVRTLRKGEGARHFKMLNLCFNPWGSKADWKKRYANFPNFDPSKNVVVIEDKRKWAGGGTAWFRDAILKNNKRIMVYEAGDLYVHPNHRGKGIYSTAMRGLNGMAQKRGAVLGFAFPNIFGVANIALPKYGFTDVFCPITRILLLKPERFFEYFLSRLEEFVLPKKFEGLKIKLVVFLDKKSTRTISKIFHVKDGRLRELKSSADSDRLDLTIKSDLDLLTKTSSLLYRQKKKLYLYLLLALLSRRLSIRFSMRFLRTFLG